MILECQGMTEGMTRGPVISYTEDRSHQSFNPRDEIEGNHLEGNLRDKNESKKHNHTRIDELDI